MQARPPNEATNDQPISWEYQQLPESPERMTFRGRYTFQDQEVMRLAGIENLPLGTAVTVLDFAGGVLDFGSPTAHDLVDAFDSIGQSADVTVVDKNIPKDLSPKYPQVKYQDSLRGVGTKQFDIVRVLRLVEHLSEEDYAAVRSDLVKHIKEGGLFVATQVLKYDRGQDKGYKAIDPVIKVMQMREGNLVPVALLPDSQVPWGGYWNDGGYEEFKDNVSTGVASIERKLSKRGIESAIYLLSKDTDRALEALSGERTLVQPRLQQDPRTFRVTYPHKGDIVNLLNESASTTAELFSKRGRIQKTSTKVTQLLRRSNR